VRKATLSRRSSAVVAFAVGAAVITPLAFSASPAAAATNAAPARAEAGPVQHGGGHVTAAVESRDGGQRAEAPAGPAGLPIGRLVGSSGSIPAS
jgi:hypothetical protein